MRFAACEDSNHGTESVRDHDRDRTHQSQASAGIKQQHIASRTNHALNYAMLAHTGLALLTARAVFEDLTSVAYIAAGRH